MRIVIFVSVALLVQGCGAGESASSGEVELALDGPSVVPGAPAPSAVQPKCVSGRQWTLSLEASGLDEWEGRRLWISAVEPVSTGEGTLHEIAGRLETTITYGLASMSCVQGLTTNYWYPSAAVVVDADGSGACSAGDFQFTVQYYGWNEDQLFTIEGSTFSEQGFELGTAWTPVSETGATWEGESFCSYYGLGI